MHTAEVEDEILLQLFFGYIDERHIRAHWVAVLIGRPVLRRLGSHAGAVLHKRVVYIDIDRCAIALRLPVAGDGNPSPMTHVVVLAIKILRTFLGIATPVEQPLSVETHNFLTILLTRRKLQRSMIRKFIDAQHSLVLPVGSPL